MSTEPKEVEVVRRVRGALPATGWTININFNRRCTVSSVELRKGKRYIARLDVDTLHACPDMEALIRLLVDGAA